MKFIKKTNATNPTSRNLIPLAEEITINRIIDTVVLKPRTNVDVNFNGDNFPSLAWCPK
jgi:hypothetical protein